MGRTIRLAVKWNERVALLGKTGGGKTYFERYLSLGLDRYIVLDPKGMIDPEAWNLEDYSRATERRMENGKPGRILVRADKALSFDRAMEFAWDIGDVTIYIDEIYGVVPPGQKPFASLTALYTRGRERGIGVHAATQRPSWVPLFMLSEAEWFFCFRLLLAEDRKRVSAFMGPEVLDPIPREDRYGFWMYNVQWIKPIYVPQFVPPKKGDS